MNTVKKTRKETNREKIEKAKCKNERPEELPAKERMKALEDVIDHLKHVKNLNGFIVLVDEREETEDGTHVKGLNACCGPCDVLTNLIANIDEDLLHQYERRKKIKSIVDGLSNKDGNPLSEIDKALKDIFSAALK